MTVPNLPSKYQWLGPVWCYSSPRVRKLWAAVGVNSCWFCFMNIRGNSRPLLMILTKTRSDSWRNGHYLTTVFVATGCNVLIIFHPALLTILQAFLKPGRVVRRRSRAVAFLAAFYARRPLISFLHRGRDVVLKVFLCYHTFDIFRGVLTCKIKVHANLRIISRLYMKIWKLYMQVDLTQANTLLEFAMSKVHHSGSVGKAE